MMKVRALALLLPCVMLLAACETTGNPREGGLFGWSEAKARERQAARRQQVAAAEGEVAHAERSGAQLGVRKAAASQQVATASSAHERELARLQAKETAIHAKAGQLENDSPTAATASRARQLRLEVEAVSANRTLSLPDRARQLRELETEIDAAAASVSR
jgi:hypothetical protein